MANHIQIRRDTAANWATANPTLAQGELGWQQDTTGRLKIGDGSTPWNTLNAWIAPTFQNSWVNYGSPWANAGYRKSLEGEVVLHGLVKGGASGSVVFTLPAGFIPGANEIFAAVSNDAFAEIRVGTDGTVTAFIAQTAWLSLNGVRFLAEQ